MFVIGVVCCGVGVQSCLDITVVCRCWRLFLLVALLVAVRGCLSVAAVDAVD